MPPDNDVQKEIKQLESRYADHPDGLTFAHLADAYRRAGEYGKAEGLILHGLKNHPNYISAYNVLGRVYVDGERYSDAHEQFSRALELDPQNMIAMRALGELAVVTLIRQVIHVIQRPNRDASAGLNERVWRDVRGFATAQGSEVATLEVLRNVRADQREQRWGEIHLGGRYCGSYA